MWSFKVLPVYHQMETIPSAATIKSMIDLVANKNSFTSDFPPRLIAAGALCHGRVNRAEELHQPRTKSQCEFDMTKPQF